MERRLYYTRTYDWGIKLEFHVLYDNMAGFAGELSVLQLTATRGTEMRHMAKSFVGNIQEYKHGYFQDFAQMVFRCFVREYETDVPKHVIETFWADLKAYLGWQGVEIVDADTLADVYGFIDEFEAFETEVETPCGCFSSTATLDVVVMHLNDNCKWTRERIANWMDGLHEAGVVDLSVESPDPDRA